MAEKDKKEEKFYTPEEVAVAVLKKAQELLKNSSLLKANTSHEIEAGEEPNNDDAEAPEYLANADIEDSSAAHESRKAKKAKPGMEEADEDGDGDVDGDDAVEMADKDKDGDVDGDDAVEAKEEESGEDLDNDEEAGEPAEHKEKVKAASKPAPKMEEDKDADETIEDAAKDKKKPPFMKSEKGVHQPSWASKARSKGGESSAGDSARSASGGTLRGQFVADRARNEAKMGHRSKLKELKDMPKPNLPKSENMEVDLKKPSLKKFMLRRKMKKASGVTADARAAEKMSGAPAAPASEESFKEQPSPAEKVKAQPKLQMEKNKATEKLLGIKPKAGK